MKLAGLIRNQPDAAASYFADIFVAVRGLFVEQQERIAKLERRLSITHAQAPAPNLVILPNGLAINLDHVVSYHHVKDAIEVVCTNGDERLRGDDAEALLNYLNRIAPHILLSGLTASERIADEDAEELRR